MRLEELPKIYRPETLSLMDRALEQAWRELKRRGTIVDANAARERLTTTIVALASVGETDFSQAQAVRAEGFGQCVEAVDEAVRDFSFECVFGVRLSVGCLCKVAGFEPEDLSSRL